MLRLRAIIPRHFTPFSLVFSLHGHINVSNTNWWVEYSFPMCVYTVEQLKLLKGRLATPCQIHLKNAVTFNTKMELLPCDMYIYRQLGKFGVDFSSYKEL